MGIKDIFSFKQPILKMKTFATLALLGAVSANFEDATNALKVSVSKKGQLAIHKEFKDVEKTVHWAADKTVAGGNLKKALKQWAHSKEVANLKKLDKKFLKSPAGKRLIKEWKDVGRVLKNNLHKTENGVYLPNKAMKKLSGEMDDVADQYKGLEGSKWHKAYKAGWKAATHSKSAKNLGKKAHAFKKSKPGKALRKEVGELKHALKKHVKVTDIPKAWKKKMNFLKIEIEDEDEIEDAVEDVKHTWKKIEGSKVIRNLGESLEEWGKSDEVEHLKELDKKFLASKEGKALVKEWKDFGEALKKHVKETEKGIHIDNENMDDIEDEFDDVIDQYKGLEGSKWDKAYKAGWEDATTSDEAHSVERRWKKFEKSKEAEKLGKSLKNLDETLKENVHVSDVPKKWKKGMESLLHVEVHNKEDIADEWQDVENVWDDIEDSKVVRNLGDSLKEWGESDEIHAIKKLDKKFLKTERGQKMAKAWGGVFKKLDQIEKETFTNDSELYINNKHLDQLSDRVEHLGDQYESLEKSKWGKVYKKAYEKAFSNDEAHSVERRAKKFKHSKEGKSLKKELEDFGHSLEENVEVTDVPERWKKDMFLF